MSKFEYRVVPAPVKGKRARGVRGAEGRFAHALEELMNEMAGDGWEYWRSETLPSEERSGLTSTTTTYRNVMIFRRQKMSDTAPFQPELLSPPAEEAILLPPATGLRDTGDNGVEETADDDGFAELLRRRAARLMGAPAASADTVEAVVTDTEAARRRSSSAKPSSSAVSSTPLSPVSRRPVAGGSRIASSAGGDSNSGWNGAVSEIFWRRKIITLR